jgi:lipopolysaccharide biosynthesis glycosyltransferase
MNCIFLCIFNDINYIKFFYLLLESIYIYGNINDETDILIYTSTNFMNKIKDSHLFIPKIKFETNNDYNTINQSCKSRLDIFTFSSIQKYTKFLYLDLDIVVKSDINKIFDVIKEDILYVLEEGNIGKHNYKDDYWGNSLFGDEISNYEGKTAFTSGILLFNNCETIQILFEQIKEDMEIRPHHFQDQPHIVYNAMKYNLYNNQILKSFVVNRDSNIDSDKIIHHFPGGPGIFETRITTVATFLNNVKYDTIIDHTNKAKEYINMYLLPIVYNYRKELEDTLFAHYHTKLFKSVISKPNNISNLLLNKNIKRVLVIGNNSVFSTLVMLITNTTIKIDCFDLGQLPYNSLCYEKIKETFGNRINIYDNIEILESIDKSYDLIHIDYDVNNVLLEYSIIKSYRLSIKGTIIIMDNYNLQFLHQLWDEYIIQYNLKSLDIDMHYSSNQDIKYVIK